ncbi:hypothetical protein Agub_g2474 [Astrephomene gubernaculifera]|uniref:26S proteasome non-ATPase regulatory subunit 9 n=1 Tax=Astrephomene gubernaculifera TaxID=47775 RepID=A0AAD3DJ95_9CHLO|nr:hypothetical protein Agub_g2474 [Astrephomene gubernaculifera]
MSIPRSSVDALRQELRDLDNQRRAIEDEIALLSERLNAPGQPGIKGSLLDKEGFPRADIDVAQVRRDRNRLIFLTNDQKTLTDKLARLLGELHTATRAQQSSTAAAATPSEAGAVAAAGPGSTSASLPSSTPSTAATQAPVAAAAPSEGADAGTDRTNAVRSTAANGTAPMDVDGTALASGSGWVNGEAVAPPAAVLVPFALVDEVSEGSPAALAGLQVGDLLCGFGDVAVTTTSQQQPPASSSSSASLLQRVAGVLASSEGRQVVTRVLRQGAPRELQLVPQRWAGRGLLGCHLRPL